jgi:hypothetical protein
MPRDTQEWVKAIRPNPCPSLAGKVGGVEQNGVSTLVRRLLILSLAAALLGALVVPLAGAAGPTAVAAKKKSAKCKKKGAKKSKAKAKKCVRTAPPSSHSSLPGGALSPDTPVAPAVPTVSALTVTSNPVLGGNADSGQVTISQPAPPGGKVVTLSPTSGRASVPGSVVVAEGQTTAGFSITTTTGPTVFVPIDASIGSSSQQVQLKVVQQPSVESVALDYNCFPESQSNFGANLVTTDVPVPANTIVTLGSDSASLATPVSVTVLEANSSAGFGVDTLLATPLGTPATVTAILGTSTANDTASVRSNSTASQVVGVTLNPSTVPPGGASEGTVTIDCEARPAGEVVGLASSNAGVHVDPNVVTVLNGQLTQTFPITVDSDASGEAIITATSPAGCTPGPGCASVQATLVIGLDST